MARVLLLPRQLGHGFPAPPVTFTPWVCSCCCLSRGSAATKTQPRGCLPLAALFCHSLEEPHRPHPARHRPLTRVLSASEISLRAWTSSLVTLYYDYSFSFLLGDCAVST